MCILPKTYLNFELEIISLSNLDICMTCAPEWLWSFGLDDRICLLILLSSPTCSGFLSTALVCTFDTKSLSFVFFDGFY